MQYIFLILFFFFGAAIGSFINVIADRFNTGLSFWKGRSFCFACGQIIQKRDLLPIFSFLHLQGKCRYCGASIGGRTLLIEILMGVLSVLAAFKAGLFSYNFQSSIFNFGSLILILNYLPIVLYFLFIICIFALVLLISIYDMRHFIIPDRFLILLFILAILNNLYFLIINRVTNPTSYLLPFIAGTLVALPFLLLFLISRGRWIGFGDIKYIFVIGFLLGLVVGLSAVVLAFWIGAVFSSILLLLKKIKSQFSLPSPFNNLTIKSEIPFGPFLSLGVIISLYFELDIFHLNEIWQIFK